MGTIAAALACLFGGLALGLFVGGRPVAQLRRERAALAARVRANVLPILEQRAAAVVPSVKRDSLPAEDPLESAVELGRAILEQEARRDLPFTDTLEIAKADVGAIRPPSASDAAEAE